MKKVDYLTIEFSLHDEKTRWTIRLVALLSVFLCANVLRGTAEESPFYIRVINGFVLSLVINGPMLVSVSDVGFKFRYVLFVPFILSGLAVALVLWAYHFVLIPVVLGLYVWVGFKLFYKAR